MIKLPYSLPALLVIYFGSISAFAATTIELNQPAAPAVTNGGASGNSQAAYWVAAATGDIRQGGKLTSLSPATLYKQLPEKLDEKNPASIQIHPVEGATLYYVYKTAALPAPDEVKVTVKNSGDKTCYYWLVVCNGWRQSELYGPYPAANCGDPQGNVIEWSPVPDASWYHLYRTDTPEKPIGRTYCVVGLKLGTRQELSATAGSSSMENKVTDRGPLSYGVAGFSATPITEPPFGEGYFLLGSTGESTLRDTGQSLQLCIAPSINQTKRTALTVPSEGSGDLSGDGYFQIRTRLRAPHLERSSFISHYSPFVIDSVVEAGPHSEYFGSSGSPGWKSTVFNIESHQTLFSTSQATMFGGYQRNYGSGDTMYYNASTELFGPNRDDGDEGGKSMRVQMVRTLQEYSDTLAEKSDRGGTRLVLQTANFGAGGTGRLVVNLSQTFKEGRVRRVGNVEVYGRGTRWTSDMAGDYISFDVDTVKGHRMWYQIIEVIGPEELKIFARTEWSHSCNLGYSRYIYDPTETDHPAPAYVSSLQNNYLPPEHLEAARNGGYLICPGTYLGNPWKENKILNVDPLRETWKKGDQVQIAAGPQAYVSLGTFHLDGDYTPQDDVSGLSIRNIGNRMANRYGLAIGVTGDAGFAEGLKIALSKTGASDGIVVSSNPGYDNKGLPGSNSGVRRGAIVLPENVPGIVGENDWLYPHIRWSRSEDNRTRALEIATKSGRLVAGFEEGCLTLGGSLKGSSRTRGKSLFSGDGSNRTFKVNFEGAYKAEPFVTVSTNQFARSRIAAVTTEALTVEFETAPEAGNENVVIWWMAQE